MKTINYILIGILVVFVIMILVFRTTPEKIITEENLSFCNVDADCVPFPAECHTKTCINKQYANNFEEPEGCTMIFDPEAAYTPECCICVNNYCTNNNLGRTMEDI